jgi:protein O-GlcNAc transferase
MSRQAGRRSTSGGADHATQGAALLAAGDVAGARTALARARRQAGATPITLLNWALAEQAAGCTAAARDMIVGLTEILPDWAEAWLRLAELDRAQDNPDAAAAAYLRVLDCDPLREEALVALAALRIAAGQGGAAQSLLLRCLGKNPDRLEAWDALGLALMQTGDAAAAESAFAQAQTRDPENIGYAMRRAQAAFSAGTAMAELERLRQAGDAAPGNVALLVARAVLLELTEEREAALETMEAAAILAPRAAIPALLLADMLVRSGRGAEAVVALRHALSLHPDNLEIANNLGAVLMRQHRHAEARQVFQDLRDQHGDDPVCLCNLANVMVLLGEHAQALTIARQAVALAPESALAYRALANILPYCAGIDAAEVLSASAALSDRLPREDPPFTNPPDAARRLRVGLLSGSFRTHPVGWLTVAALENLAPDQFDLIFLASHASKDPMARRFRAIAAEWHDVSQQDDAALARLARERGIDLLIDLGGYGDAGRMSACARRLAPVQVKWVGMQNHSTGLREMDWFITDRWETPAEYRALYTERLLRLPDGYVCYSPPPHAPDVVPPPALRNGHVTFGCFNNIAKITPDVIATWAEILHARADARLILKTHQFSDAGIRQTFEQRFVAHGIAPHRLELRGASPHREFLRQYGDVDIALDPFPYTGGLTTCEGLWMGVPTITLAGALFSARHSLSHLSNVGLADWAARDRAAYVRLAVDKSADPQSLADLREGLRARVKSSPLCNAPRFGRHLGAALRHAWRDWCAQQCPDAEISGFVTHNCEAQA